MFVKIRESRLQGTLVTQNLQGLDECEAKQLQNKEKTGGCLAVKSTCYCLEDQSSGLSSAVIAAHKCLCLQGPGGLSYVRRSVKSKPQCVQMCFHGRYHTPAMASLTDRGLSYFERHHMVDKRESQLSYGNLALFPMEKAGPPSSEALQYLLILFLSKCT